MQFTSLVALAALISSAFAVTVSYDQTYDNPSDSLAIGMSDRGSADDAVSARRRRAGAGTSGTAGRSGGD